MGGIELRDEGGGPGFRVVGCGCCGAVCFGRVRLASPTGREFLVAGGRVLRLVPQPAAPSRHPAAPHHHPALLVQLLVASQRHLRRHHALPDRDQLTLAALARLERAVALVALHRHVLVVVGAARALGRARRPHHAQPARGRLRCRRRHADRGATTAAAETPTDTRYAKRNYPELRSNRVGQLFDLPDVIFPSAVIF